MRRYSLLGTQMICNAQVFATAAHGAIRQVRKYTGEPYITHPAVVAEIVALVPGHTWQMISAAWLHDVLEDTGVTEDTIREIFGAEVTQMVKDLTNVPLTAGNRAARYQMNLEKLSKASPQTKTIKIADLLHNTKSIVEHDRGFAPVYLREKLGALDVLREGDPVLWAMAYQQCVSAMRAAA